MKEIVNRQGYDNAARNMIMNNDKTWKWYLVALYVSRDQIIPTY